MKIRTGTGYDIHPLEAGRPLILGGVDIPYEKGLVGWSDADVLTHAVIEALLGAAALADIGTHFPPGRDEYRAISSLVLLEKTVDLLKNHGWHTVNIDSTVIAEKPRLREYIDEMRENLGRVLGIDTDCVSVKASTANGVGSLGGGAGIAAMAAALIEGDE